MQSYMQYLDVFCLIVELMYNHMLQTLQISLVTIFLVL
jgi:hypothetical protein